MRMNEWMSRWHCGHFRHFLLGRISDEMVVAWISASRPAFRPASRPVFPLWGNLLYRESIKVAIPLSPNHSIESVPIDELTISLIQLNRIRSHRWIFIESSLKFPPLCNLSCKKPSINLWIIASFHRVNRMIFLRERSPIHHSLQ